MPDLRLNRQLFEKYMEENKLSIPKMARKMNINRTYLHKVLKDDKNPGKKFIEGTLKVLPYKFENIFLTRVDTKRNTNKEVG